MERVTNTTYVKLTKAGAIGFSLDLTVLNEAAAQTRVLDTVTVTAQEQSEDINKVPVSVTAFEGDALTELSIEDPIDLAGQTPGLSTTNNSVGAPSFSIRGVGLEDFIGNNTSGTAIYVDEIYPVSAVMHCFRLSDRYDGVARLSYTYTDGMTQSLADRLSRSEGIQDLGIRFTIEDKQANWSAAVFAQNLMDDVCVTFAYGNLLGNQTYFRQRPQVIGVELKLSR